MSTGWAIFCACAAAVCGGTATVLQSVAARRTPTAERVNAMLLLRLLRQLPYLTSLVLDIVGFVLTVVALHTLPLFMVQSTIAGSVGVTAVVAAIALQLKLGGRDIAAIAVLIGGLALLAASAQPEHATTLSSAAQWVLLAAVVPALALAMVGVRARSDAAAVVLASAAGLSWTLSGMAARVLRLPDPLWHVVGDRVVWALALAGILGMWCFAAALQRGNVTTMAAIMFTVETILPAVLGVAFLGDHARPHRGAFAVAGVIIALGASIQLARNEARLTTR